MIHLKGLEDLSYRGVEIKVYVNSRGGYVLTVPKYRFSSILDMKNPKDSFNKVHTYIDIQLEKAEGVE
jgi:hypothetical protein